MSDQCRLYLQKRTSLSAITMSALCQKRTLAPSTGDGLRAGTRDEAANLGVAVAIVIRPHNGRAKTVGLSHNGVVRHPNPFPLNSYAIVPILSVPIDILHADTVGKSAAQSVSAGEAVEPLLKRR